MQDYSPDPLMDNKPIPVGVTILTDCLFGVIGLALPVLDVPDAAIDVYHAVEAAHGLHDLWDITHKQ